MATSDHLLFETWVVYCHRLSMTRAQIKRFVAALLPLFYLWAFVACVSICEQNTFAAHTRSDLSRSTSINEINHVPDCDGCPLSYFPKATTPVRAQYIHGLSSLSSLPVAISALHSVQPSVFSDLPASLFDNASPPLNLLPTLRI